MAAAAALTVPDLKLLLATKQDNASS